MLNPIRVDKEEFGYRGKVGAHLFEKIRVDWIYEKTVVNNLQAVNEFQNVANKLSVAYVF